MIERFAWSRDPDFVRGARDMRPVALGIAAWGLVTGVAMAKSGIGLPLSILMTMVVYAGSAQLAALPLIAAGAPMGVILATAFCVNLRFVIFSAQWRPYLVHLPLARRLWFIYFAADLNYVVFMRRFPDPVPSPAQQPYYWGGVCTIWPSWQIPNLVGIVFADAIPTAWGIGFAGTLALLGFTYSMLADRSTWISAAVAACAAIAAYAAPLRLNIVIAIAAAVAIGLLMDSLRPPPPPPPRASA
jgi:predicted branched-subunit amino acid permease